MGLFSKKAAAEAEAPTVDAEAPAVVPAVVVPAPEAAVELAPHAEKKHGFSLFGSKDKSEQEHEPVVAAPAAHQMTHSEWTACSWLLWQWLELLVHAPGTAQGSACDCGQPRSYERIRIAVLAAFVSICSLQGYCSCTRQ